MAPRLTPEGRRIWGEISQKIRGLRRLHANPRVTPAQIHEKQLDVLDQIQAAHLETHMIPDPTPDQIFEQSTFVDPETGVRLQMGMRSGAPHWTPIYDQKTDEKARFDPATYMKQFDETYKHIERQRQDMLSEDEDMFRPPTVEEVQQHMFNLGFPMPDQWLQQRHAELQAQEEEEKRRARLQELQRQGPNPRAAMGADAMFGGALSQGVQDMVGSPREEPQPPMETQPAPGPRQQQWGPAYSRPDSAPEPPPTQRPEPPAPEPESPPRAPEPSPSQRRPSAEGIARRFGPMPRMAGREHQREIDAEPTMAEQLEGIREQEQREVKFPTEKVNAIHDPMVRALQDLGYEKFEFTLWHGEYFPVVRVQSRQEAEEWIEKMPGPHLFVVIDDAGQQAVLRGKGRAPRQR